MASISSIIGLLAWAAGSAASMPTWVRCFECALVFSRREPYLDRCAAELRIDLPGEVTGGARPQVVGTAAES